MFCVQFMWPWGRRLEATCPNCYVTSFPLKILTSILNFLDFGRGSLKNSKLYLKSISKVNIRVNSICLIWASLCTKEQHPRAWMVCLVICLSTKCKKIDQSWWIKNWKIAKLVFRSAITPKNCASFASTNI